MRGGICKVDGCDNEVIYDERNTKGHPEANKKRCLNHKVFETYEEGEEIPVEVVPGGSYKREAFEGAVKLKITEVHGSREECRRGLARYDFALYDKDGNIVNTHECSSCKTALNVVDNGKYTISVNWDGTSKSIQEATNEGDL